MTKESDYAGRLRGWIGHPACPAKAVQDDLRAGADEIERLQAKIDALMLEHCPDEMTPEQRAEWAKHQRPSVEPSGCPEHGMEHFFEGMCIKCGVVPAVKSEALQPIFTVCGTCQRKATVTSQSEVKLLGIICERADCPGRPSQRTNLQP